MRRCFAEIYFTVLRGSKSKCGRVSRATAQKALYHRAHAGKVASYDVWIALRFTSRYPVVVNPPQEYFHFTSDGVPSK